MPQKQRPRHVFHHREAGGLQSGVKEIQVKNGAFEAEYGGAMGGVINVITKSGTNSFHGEGALSYTGSGLNSRPRGTNRRDRLVRDARYQSAHAAGGR